MIIDELKLSAFGPFKNEYIIDFSTLNKSGIFLLTGETGVGKTSIFDSIIYALYGCVSSSEQTLERVRSDYADESNLTYVELTFHINDKKYNIRRSPFQRVKKGNKIVNREPECCLKYDDVVLEKTKAVNSKIVEIIGLNVDQFRQIVMIPQGQFMKLLTSSSEEKVKIFRQIFKTNDMQKFEDLIYKKSNILLNGISDVTKEINIYLSDLIENDESENIDIRVNRVEEKIEGFNREYNRLDIELKESLKTLNSLKDDYNKKEKFNEDISLFKKNKEEFLELKKSTDQVNDIRKSLEMANKAHEIKSIDNKINDYKSQIDNINNNIKIKNDEISKLKEELDKNEKIKQHLILENQNIEESKIKLNEYRKKQKNIDEYNQLSQKLDEISFDISKGNKRINELGIILDNYNDSLIKLNDLIENLNDEIKKESLYVKDKFEIQEKLNSLDKYEEFQAIIDEANEKALELGKSAQQKYLKAYDYEEEIIKYRKMIVEDQAAFFSMNLKEGEPCPVCGSRHHPQKALAAEIEVTNEMIDDLVKKKETIQSEGTNERALQQNHINNARYFENEQLKLNIDYTDDLRSNLLYKLNEVNGLLNNISENKIKLTDLNKEYQSKLSLLNESKEEKDDLNQKVNSLIKDVELISQKIDSFNIDDSESIDDVINDLESKIKKHEDDMNYYINIVADENRDISVLLNNIENDKSTINRIVRELSEKMQEKNKYQGINYDDYILDDNIINSYNQRVKDFDEKMNFYREYLKRNISFDDKNEVDLKSLKENIVDLENKYNIQFEDFTNLKNKINNYENKLSKIKICIGNSNKKIEDYERIKRISNVTNGSNRLKMSFEKYVLAIYFEDVIEYANEILKKLTDRYILLRKDDLGSGNSHQGLDIDIYDFNTCQRRSVKTLSGGETFKASLALALGLSEMIKRRRSVVDINTMFIDEGFGTLDSESLDSAINMLVGFKNEGLKIGIISHVAELKNRIDSRIVVSRNNSGSTLKVVR